MPRRKETVRRRIRLTKFRHKNAPYLTSKTFVDLLAQENGQKSELSDPNNFKPDKMDVDCPDLADTEPTNIKIPKLNTDDMSAFSEEQAINTNWYDLIY
jgi:hypothetical protein